MSLNVVLTLVTVEQIITVMSSRSSMRPIKLITRFQKVSRTFFESGLLLQGYLPAPI